MKHCGVLYFKFIGIPVYQMDITLKIIMLIDRTSSIYVLVYLNVWMKDMVSFCF
jgi:hypothetical protein